MTLKPRFSRTKMACQRRAYRRKNAIFNRFHFYKIVLKHGRRKLSYWWKK